MSETTDWSAAGFMAASLPASYQGFYDFLIDALEQVACITGNLSTPLLASGTPKQVEEATKSLLDSVIPGRAD